MMINFSHHQRYNNEKEKSVSTEIFDSKQEKPFQKLNKQNKLCCKIGIP